MVVFLNLLGMQAHALIVCKAESSMGPVTVQYDSNKKTVSVAGAALDKSQIYANTVDVWDGHATGLITTRGFAMKYNNWYGCIRNVEIITNLRSGTGLISTVKVELCTSGSTPNEICGGN